VRASAEWAALGSGEDTGTFLEQSALMRRAAPPLPLARLVDHVLHAVEVAGVEHVGLGSDYDGILRSVEGVEDASGYGALAAALRARGLGDRELRLVLGGNMERVFARATGPGTRAHAGTVTPALV
jgi:membrane dipeptidase